MSELKKLTRLGSDTKKIAALLQAKAPKGHMLAYINPKEAAILKARGGSGKPHADTGILSFEETDTSYGGYDIQGGQDFAPPSSSGEPMTLEQVAAANPELYPGGIQPGGISTVYTPSGGSFNTLSDYGASDIQKLVAQQSGGAPTVDVPSVAGAPTPSPVTSPFAATSTQMLPQAEAERYQTGVGGPAEKEAGIADQLAKSSGLSKDALGRLGLAGVLGMLGSRQATKASEVGQKGAQQIQALASPYQAAGQQLQAQAQRGELTPAAQQSIQAMQAQAAQAAERRGGVGAQQAQAQVERLRQQLLQQQYDYGLKLSGIGDNIALGAIKTGMQADQYVNQLTNQFYSNMAYIASGMSPGVRVGGNQ